MEEAEDDARLLANFGILCYWLMFIESKELRERLQSEDMDEEEEDDADADTNDGNGFDTSENIESVIESSYLFKTPIGVHILYQHSNSALRRAVALSPNSAMFLEHLVQLLVLVGDIQPACDYLEAFFHLNPEDPHGPRMVRYDDWFGNVLESQLSNSYAMSTACRIFGKLLPGFRGCSGCCIFKVSADGVSYISAFRKTFNACHVYFEQMDEE